MQNENLLFSLKTNNEYAYAFYIYEDGALVSIKNSTIKIFSLKPSTLKKFRSQIKKSQKRLNDVPQQLIGYKDGLIPFVSEVCFGDKIFFIDYTINDAETPNENYRCTIKECLDALFLLGKLEPLVINDTGIYMLDHSQDIHIQIQTTRQQILNETDVYVKYSLITFLMTILHWSNYEIYYLTSGTLPISKNDIYSFCLLDDVVQDCSYDSMPFNDFMNLLMKINKTAKVKYQHALHSWSLDAVRDCILANKTI